MGLLQVLMGEEPGLFKKALNYRDKGQFGEYLVEYALTNKNIAGNFAVMKNIYVPKNIGSTEIDVLMIHEKGIFVFESKNYSGWIFGDSEQKYWTQSLQGGKKNHFYNPVRQNRSHIKALAEFLDKPQSAFTSYIVFSERCTLKSVPANTKEVVIVRRPDMLYHLRNELSVLPSIYSYEEILAMANSLAPHTNKTEAQKAQHVNNLREKCPYCGADLVLRNGRYGQFWGCSAYPKCKFTRNL